MSNKTPSLITVIAFLMIGLSLVSAVTLTASRTVHADPGVLYAAPTAQGNGDCSSWEHACPLQIAMAGAVSGDEIWVRAGVHYPGSSRTDTFALKSSVALYGGFAGTEISRDQRNWQTNVTVLSGDIDQNDLTDPNGVVTNTLSISGTNSYHVVSSSGVTETAVLDGFFITAGQANGTGPSDEECNGHYCGGGMYNDHSNPTLTNLTFSGNSADHNGGGMYNIYSSPTLNTVIFRSNTSVAWDGGGMFNRESSPALTNVAFYDNRAQFFGGGMGNGGNNHSTLTNVTFSGNQATWGGGMSNNWLSNPTLNNVTFDGNLGYDSGGGIYNFNQSSPTLTNVVFSGNVSGTGGGMNNYWGGNVSLTNVTFSDNQANTGGGMYNNTSTVVMAQVLFSGNQGVNGGAMHNFQSSVAITNTIISGNVATGEGGGIYNDGSGYFIQDSIMVLTLVLFSGNKGANGGAMHNIQSSVTMTNISMASNLATGQGGGIYNDGSDPYIQNTLIWGNQSGSGGDNLFNSEFSGPTIRYSLVGGCNPGGVWDSACGTDGGHNLADADPLFVDAANGNLRLLLPSPAIDAGDNAALPPNILTDLDGNPRFVNIPTVPDTGSGAPPGVDMGAFEAQFADVVLDKAVRPTTAMPGAAITFTLTLINAGSLPATGIVVTDTVPTLLRDMSFASTLTVTNTGLLPPFVWLVQDLAREQGGIITVSGVLPVPLAAGIYTHTACISAADDLLAANNTAVLTFTVPNVVPDFTSAPIITATEATSYTYTLTAQDDNGDALTITAPTLPAWLTLTDHGNGTATLSGTPTNTNIGEHTVVLRVTDSGGLADTQTFTITVWGRIYLPLVLRNTL